jgi:hypothetical protein
MKTGTVNRFGFKLPPPVGSFYSMSSARETPATIDPKALEKQIAEFLAKGKKIYLAEIGESGVDKKQSVPLGIRSYSNVKIRDTIAPKKGYFIPDDL